MKQLWHRSWPGRWLSAGLGLLRGVRIDPGAVVYGHGVQLARGCRITSGCVLRPVGSGRIVLGEGVWFARDVEVETEALVAVGARTTVQRRCSINGNTRIGADCILAPDIFISSGTHPFREWPHLGIREQERRLAAAGVSFDRPVWIQDDCWLGTHVVVAPGVTIGKGSVVGANSVVLKDVAPYSVVAGMPARTVGQRLAWEPPGRIDAAVATDWPYLLSGTLEARHGDSAAGVRIPRGEPLLVALRAPQAGEELRVRLSCSGDALLRLGGASIAVAAGDTELRLAPPAADGPWGSLRIEADTHADPVLFTHFEWTRSPP